MVNAIFAAGGFSFQQRAGQALTSQQIESRFIQSTTQTPSDTVFSTIYQR